MADDDIVPVPAQTGGSEAAVPSTEPINIDPDPTVEQAGGTDSPTSSRVRNRASTSDVWKLYFLPENLIDRYLTAPTFNSGRVKARLGFVTEQSQNSLRSRREKHKSEAQARD